MSALTSLIENIKERLKVILAEQQESELYIKIKDKYDELPTHMQRVVKYSSYSLALVFVLWLPLTSVLDSVDQNTEFGEQRAALKDFLKIQREFSALPVIPNPPSPMTLKGPMDQKIMAQGVAPTQIKETVEDNKGSPVNVEMKGIRYHIQHVTIKQALNIAYELENIDKSLRLSDLELTAEQKDPHFYDLKFRIINFAPKTQQQVTANAK